MFLTPHASAALWITTKVSNPVLAFALAVLSHFVLDAIPHGDESLGDHKPTPQERHRYRVKVAMVDVAMAIVLLSVFMFNVETYDVWLVIAAICGAWLPDLAWITIEMFKVEALYGYIKFHGRIHRLIDYHYSLVYGVPMQIIFTLWMLKITL